MHHGESNLFFYFFGLADPDVPKDRQRTRRFAGFYNGEDRGGAELRCRATPRSAHRSPAAVARALPRRRRTGRRIGKSSTTTCRLSRTCPESTATPRTRPWSDDATYAAILEAHQRAAIAWRRAAQPRYHIADDACLHAERATRNTAPGCSTISLPGRTAPHGMAASFQTMSASRARSANTTMANGGAAIMAGAGRMGRSRSLSRFASLERMRCSLTGDMRHLDLARSQLDMLWSLAPR